MTDQEGPMTDQAVTVPRPPLTAYTLTVKKDRLGILEVGVLRWADASMCIHAHMHIVREP